jgi:hypothetical protein
MPAPILPFLAQNDFVAPAKNLHLLGLEPELLRQSDGLTVAGTKTRAVAMLVHLFEIYTSSYITEGSIASQFRHRRHDSRDAGR